MKLIQIFTNLLGTVKNRFNNFFSLSDKKVEFANDHYFTNVNSCISFINLNNYELTRNLNILQLNVTVQFINSENETCTKTLGTINRPFVLGEKIIKKKIIDINENYSPVVIKRIHLKIVLISANISERK